MLCKVFRRSSVFVARREAVQGLIFMRAAFAGLCVVARREAVHGPIFIRVLFAGLRFVARREAVRGPIFMRVLFAGLCFCCEARGGPRTDFLFTAFVRISMSCHVGLRSVPRISSQACCMSQAGRRHGSAFGVSSSGRDGAAPKGTL